MSTQKIKKICKLTKYLEQVDTDLYQVFDDLCLFGLFRTRDHGITFLYPTDKAYRKKIMSYTYSSTPEKAIDMIKALILLDYLPKPTDFKTSSVLNALHKTVGVESADSKGVVLKSGHKLVVDKDFYTLRSDDPVAVYHLSGDGELPLTGEKGVPVKRVVNKVDEKNTKDDIIKWVEKCYLAGITGSKSSNIYIYEAIVAAIMSWAATLSNEDEIKKFVKYNIAAHPRATFYCMMNSDNSKRIINESGMKNILNTDGAGLIKYAFKYTEALKSLFGDLEEYNKDYFQERRNFIKSTTMLDLIKELEEIYEREYSANSKGKLYIDLLSVYCRLFEDLEEDDPRMFDTFKKSVKKYTNLESFSKTNYNDTAYHFSIVAALKMSNAFLYNPKVNYDGLECLKYMPGPNHKTPHVLSKPPGTSSADGDDSFFGGLMSGR